MKRYFSLLGTLLVLLVIGGTLAANFEKRQERSTPIDQPLAQQLLNTSMPVDSLDAVYVVVALDELHLQTEASALNNYIAFSVVAPIFGRPPIAVGTVRDAIRWWESSGIDADTVYIDEMGKALSAQLAPIDTLPPAKGRSGNNFASDFVSETGGVWTLDYSKREEGPPLHKAHYIVVDVRNELQAPVDMFSFYLRIVDKAGRQPDSLDGTEIICNFGSVLDRAILAARASAFLVCDVRPGGNQDNFLRKFSQALEKIRGHELAFTKEIKSLDLGAIKFLVMGGPRVDTSFGSPEQSEKGRMLVAASSCEQRGDCVQILKRDAAPFIEAFLVVVGVIVPGIILAGLIRLLPVWRGPAVGALALLSVLAFPLAVYFGGSGYGPIAGLVVVSYGIVGLWIGMGLGWMALPGRHH